MTVRFEEPVEPVFQVEAGPFALERVRPLRLVHLTNRAHRRGDLAVEELGVERSQDLQLGIACYPVGAQVSSELVGAEAGEPVPVDRKSTRLNSSHVAISYAV